MSDWSYNNHSNGNSEGIISKLLTKQWRWCPHCKKEVLSRRGLFSQRWFCPECKTTTIEITRTVVTHVTDDETKTESKTEVKKKGTK